MLPRKAIGVSQWSSSASSPEPSAAASPASSRAQSPIVFNMNTPRNSFRNEQAIIQSRRGRVRGWKRFRFTFDLAYFILSISFVAFKILSKLVYLPSARTVYRYMKAEAAGNLDISQLDNVQKQMEKYEKEAGKEAKQLGGFIAVDALSLKPRISITKDGIVQGLTENITVNSTYANLLRNSYKLFEKFVLENQKYTITDAFVYLYVPLQSKYPCYPIYVKGTTQGKATSNEINDLYILKRTLEAFNYTIHGFAFDGDSTYSKIRDTFINSVNNIITGADDNFTKIQDKDLIVIDPLHILKRFRYRLLANIIHCGFENITSNMINISKLKQSVDLPEIVFNSNKITRMNDELPLSMFSKEVLMEIIQNEDVNLLGFSVVPSFMNIALNENNIAIEDRIFMLNTIYWYLKIYKNVQQSTDSELRLQKTAIEKHVSLFHESLMADTISTVSSILVLISNENNTDIYLNRVGSNPVEHFFGHIRIRSKNQHIYTRLVKEIGKKQVQKEILSLYQINTRIEGKITSCGVDLSRIPKRNKTFTMEPYEVAVALLLHCNFKVSRSHLLFAQKALLSSIRANKDKMINKLFKQLISLLGTSNNVARKHQTGLSSAKLEVGSISSIRDRQNKDNPVFKMQWTMEDIQKLKDLIQIYGKNPKKIAEKLSERTVGSIKQAIKRYLP